MKKTALDSQRLLQKIQTMRIIAYCLPASKFDLYEKVKEHGIKSRVTVDDRLNELIELGFVGKGRCPTCNHEVFEIRTWQTWSDGESVCVFCDNRLDEFLFDTLLLDRIEWRVKQKEPLKKATVVKKKLTVVRHSTQKTP